MTRFMSETRRAAGKNTRSAPPGSFPPDARSVALSILNQLESGRTSLDILLESGAHGQDRLSPQDRALFNHLVYGVLRWRLRLDAVMAAYTDRAPQKMDPVVRNILRLALFQMLYMDRIPPSAAVNTAVNLARTCGAANATGFVNGLLRNVLRHPDRFQPPDPGQFPVAHLSVDTATPEWLVRRWVKRFGWDDAKPLCAAMNTIPPVTLRCNHLKNTEDELAAALSGMARTLARPAPHLIHLDGLCCPIPDMPAFKEGKFAVQDEAAQGISRLLSPRPGEQVLDACAGLGGKTCHMADLMNNQGRIIALDHSRQKLARLETEARRLGISCVETRTADLNTPLSLAPDMRFDRILLDAPCSGLGVLRRNPDAKWTVQEADIHRCARRQRRFLEHLAPWVRVGGTLVFSVCSMEPEENETVINKFLKTHPHFAVDVPSSEEADIHAYLDADGFFRTFPHTHATDGFFAARLKRIQ